MNYFALCHSDTDKELREMIMYGMRRMYDTSYVRDKTNLFRNTLLKRFKNIQTTIIYTTANKGYDPCPLSFLWLLSEIENVSFSEIIIKGVHDYRYDNEQYLCFPWDQVRQYI